MNKDKSSRGWPFIRKYNSAGHRIGLALKSYVFEFDGVRGEGVNQEGRHKDETSYSCMAQKAPEASDIEGKKGGHGGHVSVGTESVVSTLRCHYRKISIWRNVSSVNCSVLDCPRNA